MSSTFSLPPEDMPEENSPVCPQMSVSLRDMVVLRDNAEYALEKISLARLLLMRHMKGSEEDLMFLDAQETVRRMIQLLHRMGVPLTQEQVKHQVTHLTLDDLNELETPEIRRRLADLIAALKEVMPVAEALDYARGRWWEEARSWGDTPGTDTAEDLNQMLAGLHLQLSGPRGRE